METIASDVYILGHSLVNKMMDKRLSKVYKAPRGPLLPQSAGHDALQGPLVNNDNFIQALVEFKSEVSNMRETVKDEVTNLQETVKMGKY